jgi:peptidoglycan/LPS O-acetylase OafA/YrhL
MERISALEGLRAVAVAMVIAYHIDKEVVPAGHWGVVLFLVLTGYLITQMLCDEADEDGHIALGLFYLKRGVRLYPALVVLCLALVAAGMAWSNTLPTLGLYSNYARIAGVDLGVLTHTWFLAVMAHFYLLWPLVIVAVPSRQRLLVVGLLALAAIVWRVIAIAVVSPGWVYNATDTNAAALLVGCFLGVARPGPWRFVGWSIPALLLMMLLPIFGEEGPAFLWGGFVAIALGVLAIQYTVTQPAWLEAPPIVWLGEISYGIYLWHYVFLGIGLNAWVVLPLTVVIAAISWHFLEQPLAEWAARFVKREREGDPGPVSVSVEVRA